MEIQRQVTVGLGGRPPASGRLDLPTAGVGVGLRGTENGPGLCRAPWLCLVVKTQRVLHYAG